jgi:hypothetical protein
MLFSISLLVDVSLSDFQFELFVEEFEVDWVVDWVEFQH